MAGSFKAFFIEGITNMHVGSGDANYGIVDKLVQRDTVTGNPTIHPSSLKGALREHFESKWGKSDTDPDKKVDTIFGKEAKDETESVTGVYKFLGADLVSLPVRCNFEQFVIGLNNDITKAINDKSKLLTGKEVFNDIDMHNKLFYKANEPSYDIYAEDIKLSSKAAHVNPLKVQSDLGAFNKKYASLTNTDFSSISKNLPVIARNTIEDGKSGNLWYEEVVPHHALFLTFIYTTDDFLKEFEERLEKDVIQIGGNSTIGYGLCKFHKIKFQS